MSDEGITKLTVEVESLCKKVDKLTETIEKDHDLLIEHEQRIRVLEKNRQSSLTTKTGLLIASVSAILGSVSGALITLLLRLK